MPYKYYHSILGGTFDHFHVGHKKLIREILEQSRTVTIGIVKKITSKDKHFSESIENYPTRLKSLKSYLEKLDAISRTNIITINDIYGTTLTDESIEAIFVTESTSYNAKKINDRRKKLGLSPLNIVILPYVLGDDNEVISSRRIREGIINREGASYLKFFLQKKQYLLPESLRKTLRSPIGKISKIEDIPHSANIISVGDVVSIDLKKADISTLISIVDFKTRRVNINTREIEKYFPKISANLSNEAGSINPKIAELLISAFSTNLKTHESQIIAIAGEEDLLALPAILLSPLGYIVIYGQYNVGMIIVIITENVKKLVKKYLKDF